MGEYAIKGLYEQLQGYRERDLDAENKRQAIEDNALILKSKMLGLEQHEVEKKAIQKFDPTDFSTIDLVVNDLAKGGDFKGVMEVLKQKSDMAAKTRESNSKQQELQMKEWEAAGGIMMTMTDPASYETGIMQMMTKGMNPTKYGLTMSWESDQAKLPRLAQGTINAAKQVDLARQQQEADRRDARDKELITNESNRLNHEKEMERLAEKRIEVTEQANKDNADRQRLVREGAHDRFKASVQRLAKPTYDQRLDALALIDEDSRSKDAPLAMRQNWSRLLANRAARAVASRIDEENPDWLPENYSSEMQTQLDEMFKDGSATPYKRKPWSLFKSGGITDPALKAAEGTIKQPPTKQPQVKVIDPKTLKPGEFMSSPSGKKYKVIGKGSDGMPLFETDPQGRPIAY